MKTKMKFKKISVVLVASIIIAAFTPLVLAATEDHVVITFNPEGDIDIDVSLGSYNFSDVTANTWANTTGGTFTLYNNGTIGMDTQIKTNATTDQADMSLNASGVAPLQDEYAIYIDGLDVESYLKTTYGLEFDHSLLPSDSKTFDICLRLGVNLSANFSWQRTTIYFQGSIG